jgi:hypothetical protein
VCSVSHIVMCSSGSGLENREYGRRDPSRSPRGTIYPQKLTLTFPTSSGRSVGTVRSRTQTTEFSSVVLCAVCYMYVVSYCSSTATEYKHICSWINYPILTAVGLNTGLCDENLNLTASSPVSEFKLPCMDSDIFSKFRAIIATIFRVHIVWNMSLVCHNTKFDRF